MLLIESPLLFKGLGRELPMASAKKNRNLSSVAEGEKGDPQCRIIQPASKMGRTKGIGGDELLNDKGIPRIPRPITVGGIGIFFELFAFYALMNL